MNNKTKIIFFGTPKFAKSILQELIKLGDFEVVAVVTAPDKPVGRKQVLTPCEVKILAQEKNIPVLSPEKLDTNFIKKLKDLNADIFITAAYGKIIPQDVLNIPPKGNINVHPSLLPKYRGASPIQTALLNGEKETGTTIMIMDEKMDHGEIIINYQLSIINEETYTSLAERLAELSAELLIKILPDYIEGKIKPQEQDHDSATFCKMIKKSDGEIDWNKPAEEIYNLWRAFVEWPQAYGKIQDTRYNFQNFKIILKEIRLSELKNTELNPGEFFVQDKKLYITCGNSSVLEVIKIQPQGKNIMDANGFINGYMKQ